MNRPSPRRWRAGFLLLETMIGVMVFAIGVLTLARCVDACLNAESAKVWDERARVALENRMAEIEAGAIDFDAGNSTSSSGEKLTGMFEGIKLQTVRTPLHLQDDNKKELIGLFQIQLEALWDQGSTSQSKTLTFYVYQQTR